MSKDKAALQSQVSNTDGWEVTVDAVSKAMRLAYSLGQTYWQQADSDSFIQQDKSEETHAKFQKLAEETRTMLLSGAPSPTAPQQVSNTPQDGKSGWTEAPVGEWYWILRDSVDGPMWSPAFKDKYHRWCSGDWLNGVEAIQVGPKIAPPQQQEQSGEAVEWQGPRELQIDSYMTGREGVHAFVNAKAIHLEYTDGGYCWALLLPVPTRRNKSLRASPTTPTSTAIAAMVIRQALELCNQILPKDYNNSDFATGQIAANNAIVAGLRALTPANAEAELEALMMKVAEEVQKATVKAGVFSTAPTPEERRAIVRRILDEKGE
jgi:hypothetical protein